MGVLSKLLKRLFPIPSFEDLRAANRASARSLSKEEARRRIADHPLLSPPEASHIRSEILGFVDGAFDQPTRDRCDGLVTDAIAATKYLVRPGTVEEIWYLEGLLDRFLDP